MITAYHDKILEISAKLDWTAFHRGNGNDHLKLLIFINSS